MFTLWECTRSCNNKTGGIPLFHSLTISSMIATVSPTILHHQQRGDTIFNTTRANMNLRRCSLFSEISWVLKFVFSSLCVHQPISLFRSVFFFVFDHIGTGSWKTGETVVLMVVTSKRDMRNKSPMPICSPTWITRRHVSTCTVYNSYWKLIVLFQYSKECSANPLLAVSLQTRVPSSLIDQH